MDQTFTNWWVDIVQEYGSFECSLGDINIYIMIYSVSVSWSSQETSHWHLPRQQDDAEPQSQAGDADSTILQPIVSYPLLGFFTFFFNMENPSVQSVMAVLHGFPMRFGHGLAPEGSQSEQGLGQGLSCSMRTCTCIYFSFFFVCVCVGPQNGHLEVLKNILRGCHFSKPETGLLSVSCGCSCFIMSLPFKGKIK